MLSAVENDVMHNLQKALRNHHFCLSAPNYLRLDKLTMYLEYDIYTSFCTEKRNHAINLINFSSRCPKYDITPSQINMKFDNVMILYLSTFIASMCMKTKQNDAINK